MAMLPEISGSSLADLEIAEQAPSLTWAFDLKERVLKGTCDGKEAVMQAIYLILFTDRFKWQIHEWSYGHELASLFGMPLSYVVPEVERLIKEALVQDDRIDEVYNFNFERGNDRVSLFVSFDVKSNIVDDTIHIEKYEVVI